MATLELKNMEVEFTTLMDVEISEFENKTFKDDNDKIITKTAPNGKPVFKTTLKALVANKEGKMREDRNITLSLLTPMELTAGVRYVIDFSKECWVTPWLNKSGNFTSIGLSVTATALMEKPVKIKKPNLTSGE